MSVVQHCICIIMSIHMASGQAAGVTIDDHVNRTGHFDHGHKSGGLPMISDEAFSLIILIYVSVTFCFVFFMFCWKTSTDSNTKRVKRECILMTSNGKLADPKHHGQSDSKQVVVISPTPSPGNKTEEVKEDTSSCEEHVPLKLYKNYNN
jgi:hypothetical protein